MHYFPLGSPHQCHALVLHESLYRPAGATLIHNIRRIDTATNQQPFYGRARNHSMHRSINQQPIGRPCNNESQRLRTIKRVNRTVQHTSANPPIQPTVWLTNSVVGYFVEQCRTIDRLTHAAGHKQQQQQQPQPRTPTTTTTTTRRRHGRPGPMNEQRGEVRAQLFIPSTDRPRTCCWHAKRTNLTAANGGKK